MNRYRQTGPLDDAPEVIGDTAFNALDLRTDGVLLPPGTARASENFRFTPEGAQVREGLARQFAPGVFCPRILHAGLYRPESGPVRLAFVTYRSLVLVNPSDQTATEVPFPTGESVAKGDPVDFVQAGESDSSTRYAWILRGLDKDALKFDGDEIAVDANFKRGEFGLYAGGRIAVNDTSQSLAVSDFLAYGAGNWSLLDIFKIMKGGDDYLLGMLAYQQYLVIASRQRFHLGYFDPDLVVDDMGDSFLRHMTQEGGCVGRRAMILAGGKFWFVSDHGIYVFQPQLDLQLVLLGEPISAPLEPVMARLNDTAAAGACIGRYRHRLYFALPINGEAIRLSSLTITA
ncbi:MAG: hypothetical protein FJ276_26130, partial [Planctomycetes bacterium]|nr:hypothetical protein [Planctomycetota bacterium]